MREHCLHEPRIAEKINLKLSMSDFQRNTFNRTWLTDCRVIHQQVNPAFGRYNVAHRFPDGFIVGNIQADWLDMIRTYLFQPVQTPCRGKYIITILSKKFRGGPADTAGCAGYQCNPLSHIVRSFLS